MNPVAKMGFVPRGIYSNETTYDFLDFVYYNGNTYVAKKLTVGNEPQESNEYWQILAKGGIEDVGIQFQEASERQNIQSGEDAPSLFGKIKKWYADLKRVAWSGNYDDLENKPTATSIGAFSNTGGSIIGEGQTLSIFPGRIQGSGNQYITDFDYIRAKKIYGNVLYFDEENTDKRYIKREDILNTIEQIDANTDSKNVAGALAVKAIKSDLANNINQLNSNLLAVNIEHEFQNGWRWTSGTGITRIGNTVTVCLAIVGTEIEFSENDKLIQFDPKYSPNVWTQIPALVESLDGSRTSAILRVDIEAGGIVVAVPFKAMHIIVNASWIARMG